MLLLPVRLEQKRAHHRRRRQRDDHRHEDRDRQRHGELAEEASDDSAHQQDRDEDRDERDADREDGEADLARSGPGRLERRRAHLEVPGDVLDDDDRVVDDEAGRDRQRHEREVVDRVAEQVHRPEGPDQRNGNRDARNERRAHAPQEGEDHEDHEHDRDREGDLDVPDRSPDRRRAVENSGELDRRRDLGLELRKHGLDPVDGLDDVRSGLAKDDDQDRRLSVGEAGRADVLDRVDDVGDVREAERAAALVGEDERPVQAGIQELVRRADGPRALGRADLALRAVGVLAGEESPDVLERQPRVVERRRVGLDAHGRQRAAADEDLPDAVDLGDLLLEDRRGDVVDPALVHDVGDRARAA